MVIEFTVPGLPVPKGRPRVTRYGTYTPKRTQDYEKRVLEAWFTQSGVKMPEGVPLALLVMVFFPVPQSWSKKKRAASLGRPHISRPDLDNIVKSVTDALNGEAFPDDSAIAIINAHKAYAEEGHVFVAITEVRDNDSQDNA